MSPQSERRKRRRKTCPVCHDEASRSTGWIFHTFPCNHDICNQCLIRYVSHSGYQIEGKEKKKEVHVTCPTCRADHVIFSGIAIRNISGTATGTATGTGTERTPDERRNSEENGRLQFFLMAVLYKCALAVFSIQMTPVASHRIFPQFVFGFLTAMMGSCAHMGRGKLSDEVATSFLYQTGCFIIAVLIQYLLSSIATTFV